MILTSNRIHTRSTSHTIRYSTHTIRIKFDTEHIHKHQTERYSQTVRQCSQYVCMMTHDTIVRYGVFALIGNWRFLMLLLLLAWRLVIIIHWQRGTNTDKTQLASRAEHEQGRTLRMLAGVWIKPWCFRFLLSPLLVLFSSLVLLLALLYADCCCVAGYWSSARDCVWDGEGEGEANVGI